MQYNYPYRVCARGKKRKHRICIYLIGYWQFIHHTFETADPFENKKYFLPASTSRKPEVSLWEAYGPLDNISEDLLYVFPQNENLMMLRQLYQDNSHLTHAKFNVPQSYNLGFISSVFHIQATFSKMFTTTCKHAGMWFELATKTSALSHIPRGERYTNAWRVSPLMTWERIAALCDITKSRFA